MSSKAEVRRARLTDMCLALPEATHRGGQHSKFEVRGRTFVYYLFDHHGDGKVALCVKVPPGEASRLISAEPERYFSPAYLGAKGWVALPVRSSKSAVRLPWMTVRFSRSGWRPAVSRLCGRITSLNPQKAAIQK